MMGLGRLKNVCPVLCILIDDREVRTYGFQNELEETRGQTLVTVRTEVHRNKNGRNSIT